LEAGNGDRVAFHWHGEEGEARAITYAELHRDVQRFANALKDRGIGKGDVVGIYLPMMQSCTFARPCRCDRGAGADPARSR
jgi:acetyl-CoA synthetase